MSDPPPQASSARHTETRWGCLIALLAGGFLLVYATKATIQALRQTAAMTSSALQTSSIHRALNLYASDHEGRFPTGTAHANEAYRKLFPEYLDRENSFYVFGSAWHDAAPNHKPDNEIGTPPDFSKALERGENHWAYVSGLGTSSDPKLPLMADGFVEDQPGTYTDDPTKKGGRWRGTHAAVTYVDGSIKVESVSKVSGFRVLRSVPGNAAEIDIFRFPSPPAGTAAPTLLNPE